jgi:hypothetical protein
VLVKGPYQDEVQLKISSVDPPEALRASLGERSQLGGGKISLFPLSVELVPNAPVLNRLGSSQAEAGKVVIDTTHPQVAKIELSVRFATE